LGDREGPNVRSYRTLTHDRPIPRRLRVTVKSFWNQHIETAPRLEYCGSRIRSREIAGKLTFPTRAVRSLNGGKNVTRNRLFFRSSLESATAAFQTKQKGSILLPGSSSQAALP